MARHEDDAAPRPWRRRLAAALTLAAALLATTATPAQAITMVSIDRPQVHLRSGPGTEHAAQWKLARGYPLQVLERRDGWLKVRDFEGDSGWVLGRLTGRDAHVIVKVDSANLRSGPGTGYRRLGQVEYGEVLRTLDRRSGWLRVRQSDGAIGWVARRLVWGW